MRDSSRSRGARTPMLHPSASLCKIGPALMTKTWAVALLAADCTRSGTAHSRPAKALWQEWKGATGPCCQAMWIFHPNFAWM